MLFYTWGIFLILPSLATLKIMTTTWKMLQQHSAFSFSPVVTAGKHGQELVPTSPSSGQLHVFELHNSWLAVLSAGVDPCAYLKTCWYLTAATSCLAPAFNEHERAKADIRSTWSSYCSEADLYVLKVSLYFWDCVRAATLAQRLSRSI